MITAFSPVPAWMGSPFLLPQLPSARPLPGELCGAAGWEWSFPWKNVEFFQTDLGKKHKIRKSGVTIYGADVFGGLKGCLGA